MNRRAAREILLHIIYEAGYGGNPRELLEDRLTPDSFASLGEELEVYAHPLPRSQHPYLKMVCSQMEEKCEIIDPLIEKYSANWKLTRLSRISAAILRIAVFEIYFIENIPLKVSINEAVEIAKKYDTDEAPAFINGLLGALVKGEGITSAPVSEL